MTAGLEHALIESGILLFLSVLASKASSRVGIPALAVFLLIGMLAGSEGIWDIYFDDFDFARAVGTVALVLILFAGGLQTRWYEVRPVMVPGILLSTLGVAVSAAIVGVAASMILGIPLLLGLLLGSIVSSTDAAAVFGVLRARSLQLRGRLTPLLELESGANDPMAVFLTVSLTSLAVGYHESLLGLLPALAQQFVVGTLVGGLSGRASVAFINRIRLDYEGLYAAITLATALLSYAGAQELGGNGFLSVYIAGVIMGNRNFLHKIGLTQFHDGLAWLTQIGMFLTLGLLVFPSQLIPVAKQGAFLALCLMLVARPAAVIMSLSFFTDLRWNKKLFVSWVGLRGAVPIVLATIPLTEGVPQAKELFNMVFFIVVSSVLVQGTTIRAAARLLNVLVDGKESMVEKKVSPNMFEVEVQPDSHAAGRRVVDLHIPRTALIILLQRGDESYIPRGATRIDPGDRLILASRRDDILDLRKLFE